MPSTACPFCNRKVNFESADLERVIECAGCHRRFSPAGGPVQQALSRSPQPQKPGKQNPSLRVSCPTCGKSLRVPESAVAKQAKCPHCKSVFQVPVMAAEVRAAAPSVVEIDKPTPAYQPEIDEPENDRRAHFPDSSPTEQNQAASEHVQEVVDVSFHRADDRDRRQGPAVIRFEGEGPLTSVYCLMRGNSASLQRGR